MVTQLAALSFVFVTLSTGRGQGVNAPPPARAGTMSTVTLLSVGRECETGELKGAEWARGCLNFHFAIVRRPEIAGLFTLSELKDFLIDGQKYSALTQRELATRPAANTIVDDPQDYKTKIRPDLASRVPAGGPDNAVVMYTLISGAALQTGARGQVTIDVGWDKQTELLTLDFIVPPANPKRSRERAR
jgi:hypothetical protein